MGDRISFSRELQRFDDVAVSHSDTVRSIRFYYTAPSPATRDPKFIGYSIPEMQQEQDLRLDELDKNCVLSLLAALEGSFRVDYLLRCQERKKDALSRHFRGIYKAKKDRAAFEEDILEIWKIYLPAEKSVLSDLKGAFRYRHWLAHGRYSVPKLGKKYDFESVYLLAQEVDENFHLLSMNHCDDLPDGFDHCNKER